MYSKVFSILLALGFSTLVLGSNEQSPFIAPTHPFVSKTGPNLVDSLTTHSQASIFHSYLREFPLLYARLSSPLPTTLLVPRNSVILGLARKPHQELGPEEEETYLERWLKAHMIDSIVELETKKEFINFLGQKCSFEKEGGDAAFGITQAYQFRLNPGDIAVNDVVNSSNGKVIFLNGAITVE